MNTEVPMDILIKFWAKTTHDKEKYPNAYHPLLCHMIDVAMVTQVMWNQVIATATKKRIVEVLGLSSNSESIEAAGKLIAFISGLHDIGKASPPFAHRKTPQDIYKIYDNTKFAKKKEPADPECAPHGYVTASQLPIILKDCFCFNYNFADKISVVIGGHHGVFPRCENTQEIGDCTDLRGGKNWENARRALALELAQALDFSSNRISVKIVDIDNATAMIIAGLVSVADWIGSNTDYFPCEITNQHNPGQVDIYAYTVKSRSQAVRALSKLGWLGWVEPTQPLSFSELFHSIQNPNSMQREVEQLATQLRSPGIVVIEAPMGEGKTEAAMFLADHWNAILNQRGIYFALPTQATSNQMFGRVRDFLQARYPQDKTLLQLMHGHASLSAEFQTLLKAHSTEINIQGVYADDHSYSCTPGVVAAEWFTHRKRGLLAPFGVGTIDQALLAVLQTRHVFVRLFGLAHKIVIIDEVHAYDAYMSVLLERLLKWLGALGSPVILLSATLPKSKRDSLIKAYLKGLKVPDYQQTTASTYPLITWATRDGHGKCHIQTSKSNSRTLYLRDFSGDLNKLGEELSKILVEGGCIAIICNTVQKAQDIYEALSPYFPENASDGHPVLDLLHARFLYKDRAERELRSLIRFGKPGASVTDQHGSVYKVNRPNRAILVATQIIEQSLDLDFDLMISEHAPIDLLLQRSGRLHRHKRNRPAKMEHPTLWIIPNNPDDRLDFGINSLVYDEHVLLRSYLCLQKRNHIRIPEDVAELIESVYSSRPCIDTEIINKWQETANRLQEKKEAKEDNAKQKLILPPHCQDFFQDFNSELEEDNPDIHKTFQALTRDDDTPNVQVVLLHNFEEDRKEASRLDQTRWLLERSVSISSRMIADSLTKKAPESCWRENPLLRHHRLLVLNNNSEVQVGQSQLRLDKRLGIVISKLPEEK